MVTARVMTPAEAKAAEDAAAANAKATGGYDATKGPDGKSRPAAKIIQNMPDDEIRDAIQEVVDSFKGKTNREQVVGILRTSAEQLNRSGGWVRDPATLDYDPDDLDDPRANPMGLRPMPAGATRADEHTALEPDSLGTVAQRKAAEAGINEDIDLTDVPPQDREAVAIKRASQKSVDIFGTAGGSPLARAEHKNDPKPKKKKLTSTGANQRYLNALQRRRAALDAKDDLLSFTRLLMPDANEPDDPTKSQYMVAMHHRAIAAALEQVEAGKISRLIVNVPPRHGKSQLASRMFPAWYSGRHPSDSIILATYSDKLSWDFGREVRALMEDPIYSQVFPDAGITTASVDRIETEGAGKLFFVGRGSAITGRGAVGLVIDDPLKDRVEADSLVTRKKLWEWFNQVAKTRLLSSIGWIIIITTRWHEDDLVGRLTDKLNPDYSPAEGRKWKIIDLPALAKSNKDVLGRKQGEALWPERFPVAYLEDMRAADPRGFQALYQGSPTPEKGNFFPADSLKTYTRNMRPPNDRLRFYAASDHAVSLSQARDKTCLMVIGVDDENNIWVMEDLVWGHMSTSLMVERMIDLMAKYKPIMWWAERGHISKSIGPFLRKRMLERGTFTAFCEMTAVHDKQTRAQSIRGRIEMGMVYFPAFAPWWMEARQEILQFPHGVRDDVCDTLAWIGTGLVTHAPPIAMRKGKPEPKAGTLGWVKSQSIADRRERNAASRQGW